MRCVPPFSPLMSLLGPCHRALTAKLEKKKNCPNEEYFMAISAAADPPVAIRIDLFEMIRFRSLHRTSMWEAYAAPFPSSTVQHIDVCVILLPFCGFIVSGELLKQLGAFRASCRNPKNKVATRFNVWIWRARFWSRLLLKSRLKTASEWPCPK